ncbi:MAG: hypothetical protein LBD43_03440 [Holosporales bacterium]|nr:hypothetical protein [Holosporales bacterium]
MSKLAIVLGIISCSVLFFLSGTFTGYLIGESPREKRAPVANKKSKRTPSMNNPILGRIISSQQSRVMGKVRRPSNPAIDQVRSYQSTIVQ